MGWSLEGLGAQELTGPVADLAKEELRSLGVGRYGELHLYPVPRISPVGKWSAGLIFRRPTPFQGTFVHHQEYGLHPLTRRGSIRQLPPRR